MQFRINKPKEIRYLSKKNYNQSTQIYNTNVNTSFDEKLGVLRAKELGAVAFPEKIKTNPSFSVDKTKSMTVNITKKKSTILTKNVYEEDKDTDKFKLPYIRRIIQFPNPEDQPTQLLIRIPEQYYQSKLYRASKYRQNTYMMNLARQHFLQSVEAIKIGKNIKLNPPKQIKLAKKNPKFKTIFLDLDQTLIHCDEVSNNYTVQLNFPIGGGDFIQAGIRVRPYCHEFIKQLATFAQVIIFTASAASYADVVLDYLDPHKKYFAHRLYRNHCILEKGFFTKDLRCINRRPQDIAIVDNSAFSFMTQPQSGIPILPFYHFNKDKQLPSLLKYLRKLVEVQDMRQKIIQDFHWYVYKKNQQDPRKIFQNYYEQQ